MFLSEMTAVLFYNPFIRSYSYWQEIKDRHVFLFLLNIFDQEKMKNIAFPARTRFAEITTDSDKDSIFELFTVKTLQSGFLKTLGHLTLHGVELNHYLVKHEEIMAGGILEEAEIDPFPSQALKNLVASGKKSGFRRPKIMAIVNATPDSFYPGSRFGEDLKFIDKIIDASPDIIDIGGESTRPGSVETGWREETDRLEPLVEYLGNSTRIPISLDTRHPETAGKFADSIDYVNDITGFRDDRMLSVVSKNDLNCITMHMKGTPQNMQQNTDYDDLVAEVVSHLYESIQRLEEAGVKRDRIIVDPGVGFSKGVNESLEILRDVGSFRFGYSLLVGTSRKSFIGNIIGKEADLRLPATIATSVYLAQMGVDILRVHDPAENTDALKVLDRIVNFRS